MTRFLHDQFAKQILTELLSPLGQVETSKDIPAEVRQTDVLFIPSVNKNNNHQFLGLLEQLVNTASIIEPFRNRATKSDIRSCIQKLSVLIANFERQANRDNNRLEEVTLPHLWILTPTASKEIIGSFQATLMENGIYKLASALRTGIIVIHQLAPTPETLWLRILGRGKVQQQAIQELRAKPDDYPHRAAILELVYDLLTVLQTRQQTEQDLDEADRELIMQLSPLYQQRLEDATQKGRQEERRTLIERLLQTRFGLIDEELAAIIPSLLSLEAETYLPLLLELSREELLNYFRHQ